MNLQSVKHSQLLDKVAVSALYAFAFTALLSTTAATAALWVLVGLYILKAPRDGFHRARWLFLPWAALLGCLALRTAVGAFDRPEWAGYHLDGFWGWSRLLLFPVIAWWCRGNESMCRRLWGVAFAGLLFGMARSIDVKTLESAWQGMRTGFHLRIVAFGLYAGTFLWGIVCFAPEFFQVRRFRILWIALWGLSLIVLGQSLFFTQSRGVFLGFGATALIVSAVIFLTKETGNSPSLPTALKRGIIAFWILLVVMTLVNLPLVEKRWREEADTLSQLHSFDYTRPAHDSTGYRAHLYRFALEGIRARPVWGAGPAVSKRFIQESGRETLKSPNWKGEMQYWDHLHSTPLEILFHYGAVGGILWLWLYGALFVGIHRSWKQGTLSTSMWLFSLASLIYLFFWALFDFRSLHPDWRFFWNLLAGLIAAIPLVESVPAVVKESSP